MSKHTFEDFLMEKHAEQYIGVKHAMVDDSADWISNLEPDDWIHFGELYGLEKAEEMIDKALKIFRKEK